MIFVTVGTHEQQFNRLVEFVDQLKARGILEEEVIIQTGFSTYEPRCCTWQKLLPFPQMVKNVADALGLEENQVNIKATTEEGLGFTGTGQGISSQAICLLTPILDFADYGHACGGCCKNQ